VYKIVAELIKTDRQDLIKKIVALDEPKNEDNERKLKFSVIKFFKENLEPNDEAVHNLAKDLKLDPHELETAIYKLLGSLVNLKKGDVPDEKFDAKQLKMGIKVEIEEHTDDPDMAKAISKGHLVEDKFYYTKLLKAGL